MVKEAEANKEADAKKKEAADAKNDGEQTVFAAEGAIRDLGEKLSDQEKKDTQELIDDLKEALKGDNIDEIKEKTTKLNEKAMELAGRVYQEAAQAQQANNESSSDDSDSAQEAEFVDKN